MGVTGGEFGTLWFGEIKTGLSPAKKVAEEVHCADSVAPVEAGSNGKKRLIGTTEVVP
jgi:hypothetical protein